MSKKRRQPLDSSVEEQSTNLYLKEAILEVVENQLREKTPPKHGRRSSGFWQLGIHARQQSS